MPGYRKLPSGLWQATVRLPDGRRRTRTDPLKGVVQDWAKKLEADIRRGDWADPRAGTVTVAEWFEQWSATRSIEYATQLKDASHWRTHVEPRWGEVTLRAMTPWDAEAWIADMRKAEVGQTVIGQAVRLLKHLTAEAARHKILQVDPLASVKVPTPPKHVDRFLTRPEFDALVAALPTDADRAMVELAGLCGLRFGEVGGLHVHRVDLVRSELVVQETLRRNATVKNRPKSLAGARVVPMPDRVVDRMRGIVPAAGLVFPGVDYNNWRARVLLPAIKAARMPNPQPTFHDLRHSYGSWLAAAGVPPVDIMRLMGHSTLRATERYMHSDGQRFARALAALNPPPQLS